MLYRSIIIKIQQVNVVSLYPLMNIVMKVFSPVKYLHLGVVLNGEVFLYSEALLSRYIV